MLDIFIEIPDNNIPERKYAITTFLSLFTFLEKTRLVFDLQSASNVTRIRIGGATILIDNSLWTRDNDDRKYISTNYLPHPFTSTHLNTLTSIPLPIIYGKDLIEHRENVLFCGIDIFASIFFMLTRWEEDLITSLDKHLRFPLENSVAYKYNFFQIPIVNDYVELFKSFIHILNIPQYPFKQNKFELVPTHDVDTIFYRKTIKAFTGDILKRKSIKCFSERLLSVYKDPVLTFDYLMDQSEKAGVKSHFYFMASSGGQYDPKDYTSTKRFERIINSISSRGHIIGFHPGYNTFNAEDVWTNQLLKLCQRTGVKINEGRQHYLRWDNRVTKNLWNNAGMKIDSTLGYPEGAGFRCGTGDYFPLFDLEQRKQLDLLERPLILMDASFSKYGENASKECGKALELYKSTCQTYKIPYTILFHNSNFTSEWNGMERQYSDFMSSIKMQ